MSIGEPYQIFIKMPYICDCDEVSGILDERYHEGIVKDLVWDI